MNIAIVFGGKSVEHDVSIVTAKQIHNICKNMHNIFLIYVDKDGKLNLYKNSSFDFEDFKVKNKNFISICISDGHIYKQSFGKFKKLEHLDCAIMCTHGGDGENGTLCNYLVSSGVPVTAGSGVALGISMNKWLSKMFFKAINVECVKGFCVNSKTDINQIDTKIVKTFGYPVIVKANGGGSSIGIKTAQNKQELKQAISIALEFDNSAVIEQELVDFTEYNCAVFGDEENVQISQIDEPIKHNEILSFSDKYLSGNNKKGSMKTQKREFPKLDKKLQDKIQNWSKQIFQKLNFYGVVRIDYIYVPKTQKLYVNEINAIPGSLATYYFSNNKIEQSLFVDKLINIGIKNYKKHININKNFITKLF